MTFFPIHASGVYLFFVLFGCERLKLAEGSTPTAQPTYFPTLPRDEYRQFSLGWDSSMVIDDVTGMYLLIGGNGYTNGGNGKWRKCTDFDKFTCTDIHRQDVHFYTDSTLTARSTNGEDKPQRCNYPRVAQIPNGGDLLIICDGDDHLIRCPATVNGTNFEGDNCYVYMDSSTPGLSSWNDMQFPIVDKYDNLILPDPGTKKVFLCDLGVNPSCSEILDGTSTGLSSITTCETNKVVFDGGSRAFIGCTNGILEAAVSSHSAGSLTLTLTQEYMDPANQTLIDLATDIHGGSDDVVVNWVGNGDHDWGAFTYGDGHFYLASDGFYGRIFKCTAANTCEQIYHKWSMNPGADDSQSTLSSIEDLYYHGGCLYPSNRVMIFQLCPDGGIGDEDDDEDDSASPALIATSTLCGVLGVGLIGAGFYIYQLQQTLELSKVAQTDHELVEVEDVDMEA